MEFHGCVLEFSRGLLGSGGCILAGLRDQNGLNGRRKSHTRGPPATERHRDPSAGAEKNP